MFVTLLLLGYGILMYAAASGDKNYDKVFIGETIGTNSYTNPMFDMTYQNFCYKDGDTFNVTVAGTTIYGAILSYEFMGTFMFDTYLNVEASGTRTGHLAAGIMWSSPPSNE